MSVLSAFQNSLNYAWLTFPVLSPATAFHAQCSCHLSTPWLSRSPCSLSLKYHSTPFPSVKILPIFQDTAQVSLHELPSHLSSVYLSAPEYSLLPLNSHSALSLYHSTHYILLCLSSLLDSGFFIFIFTTNSTAPGMNGWSREKGRKYKGQVLPFHVQYDSQRDDKQPSIPRPKGKENQLLLEMGYDV